jgi:hypothetical protein
MAIDAASLARALVGELEVSKSRRSHWANTFPISVDQTGRMYLPRESGRTKLEIQNLSAWDIEWAGSAGLRFGGGRRVPAGMMYTDDAVECYSGEVWIVAPTGAPVLDVRVTSEAR